MSEITETTSLRRFAAEMRASLEDKLEIVLDPRARATSYLDYGCADGSLLAALKARRPESKVAGYDHNRRMVELAHETHPDILVTSNLAQAAGSLQEGPRALILSSVLHEVFSAEDDHGWQEILELLPKMDIVIIRDMAKELVAGLQPPFTAKEMALAKRVREIEGPALVDRFEAIHGPIDGSCASLAHFMLKARYPQDWDRELAEDYLALQTEALNIVMEARGFKIARFEHEALPFLEEEAAKRYGQIEANGERYPARYPCPTHLKVIYRRMSS